MHRARGSVMHRAGWAMGLALASLGLGVPCLAAAPAAQVSAVASAVRLGVAYLPPPSLPGAKARTPERIEALLAQLDPGPTREGRAARRGEPLAGTGDATGTRPQAMSPDEAIQALQQGRVDAWAGVLPADQAVPAGLLARPLPWSVAAMAILRTDTDIHAWRDLAGRTVCLSQESRHVDRVSARYGAIEQIYPAAADALLALRIGACDAAVMDEGLLENVLTFPEWQKFSARLMPTDRRHLSWLSRRPASGSGVPVPAVFQALGRQQARDIAFEVYLDQTVPDCH